MLAEDAEDSSESSLDIPSSFSLPYSITFTNQFKGYAELVASTSAASGSISAAPTATFSILLVGHANKITATSYLNPGLRLL